MRALHSYRGDAPVRTWLLAIARRTCADHLRRRQRRRRLTDKIARHTHLEASIQEPTIDDLVTRLHPDRRDAFVLTQLIGLSYKDAATVLDCPIGTIRSRIARARSDLLAAIANQLTS